MLPVITTDPPPEGHRPTERSFGILGGDFRRFFVGFFFKRFYFIRETCLFYWPGLLFSITFRVYVDLSTKSFQAFRNVSGILWDFWAILCWLYEVPGGILLSFRDSVRLCFLIRHLFLLNLVLLATWLILRLLLLLSLLLLFQLIHRQHSVDSFIHTSEHLAGFLNNCALLKELLLLAWPLCVTFSSLMFTQSISA